MLVEEVLVEGDTEVVGDGAQVIVGDGLADQAAAHGQDLDVDLGTLFNRVGEAEGDVKVRAGGKQAVLCPELPCRKGPAGTAELLYLWYRRSSVRWPVCCFRSCCHFHWWSLKLR